jgi:hypothetical protein
MEARQINMSLFLILKKFYKKGWAFLKHNWYVPAILIYTAILWLVFRRKDAAYTVLKIRNDSYKTQVEAINKAHTDEIEKRNKILEKYNEVVTKIEEERSIEEKELDSKKKKEVKKIVEKYYDKPDELAKMLADKYNFTYVGE